MTPCVPLPGSRGPCGGKGQLRYPWAQLRSISQPLLLTPLSQKGNQHPESHSLLVQKTLQVPETCKLAGRVQDASGATNEPVQMARR